MTRTTPALTGLVLSAVVVSTSFGQTPLGPGFTYQGQLKQNGAPMNGSVSLRFSLWDAAGSGSPPAGGNQIGSTQQLTNVQISSGLFTVTLNSSNQFGLTPFDGHARFLQIQVCSDSSCTAVTTLSPRQPLTVAPYATFAAAPWTQPTAGGTTINYNGGNVGIGTSAPTATLHVNGNLGLGVANIPAGLTSELGGTNTPILNLDVNFRHPNRNPNFVGGAIRIDARNDAADPLFQFISRFGVSGSENTIAVLTREGNMGIGTTTPSEKLTVDGDIRLHGTFFADSDGPAAAIFYGVGYDYLYFYVHGHTRVGQLRWDDQISLRNDTYTNRAKLEDDGSWSTVSDLRMKTDVTSAEGLLAKALALKPTEFYMKNQDCTLEPHKYIGLIAQEVQPILPSLVHADSEDSMLSMNYDRIGVVAIGAIQEQQQIILDQARKISAQQARIDDLAARLAQIEQHMRNH